METITKAKVWGNDKSKFVDVKLVNDELKIVTPISVLEITGFGDIFIKNGEVCCVIGFIKQDLSPATITAFGEVDIARALFLCKKKNGRQLVTADDYHELMSNKKCGETFRLIKTKNKKEDVRIDCAYFYTEDKNPKQSSKT